MKEGFTGVDIIYLFGCENRDCGYLLELRHEDGFNKHNSLCLEQK